MHKTREELKRERSERASRAVNARWEQYHASCGMQVYDMPRTRDMYRITVDNLISGKSHTLMLHPGPRRDNFRVDLDGKHWRNGSFSSIMTTLRKSLVKTKSGRVL